MKKTLLPIITSLLFISCSLKKGYVKYGQKEDQIIVSDNIKKYLKENPNPSIVLRVPLASSGAILDDNNLYIYNAIEKELLLAGFNVKDRGLFTEVMNRATVTNYSQINELTKADLILELVKVEDRIPFYTNKIYTDKDEEKVSNNYTITRYGKLIEFKLVMVKTNEYGGNFSFIYTPCSEKSSDCNCTVLYKNYTPVRFYYDKNPCKGKGKKIAFEDIPHDKFELFLRNGIKKMVSEIRK